MMSSTTSSTCIFIVTFLYGLFVTVQGRYSRNHPSKRTCPGKSSLSLEKERYYLIDLDQQIEQYHAKDSKDCFNLCNYDATCEKAIWVPDYHRCFIQTAKTHSCPTRHSQRRFAPFTVKNAYVWTRICDCLPIRSTRRRRKGKYGVSNFHITLESEVGFYKCRRTRSKGFHCNRQINHKKTHIPTSDSHSYPAEPVYDGPPEPYPPKQSYPPEPPVQYPPPSAKSYPAPAADSYPVYDGPPEPYPPEPQTPDSTPFETVEIATNLGLPQPPQLPVYPPNSDPNAALLPPRPRFPPTNQQPLKPHPPGTKPRASAGYKLVEAVQTNRKRPINSISEYDYDYFWRKLIF